MIHVEKPHDSRGVNKLARRIPNQRLDRSGRRPREREVITTTNLIEPGLEEKGDVGVGVIIVVEIDFLGEKGGVIFGVKELAEHPLWAASDEDTKGKGWIR